MRWIESLDAWGRKFDTRWFAWMERAVRPKADWCFELILDTVPLIGFLLLAYFLFSLVN